jgi:predicted phosphoribosyltransferase
MGFLTGLLLLPLAPLRGTIWIAERLAEQAELELDDEVAVRRLLVEAEIAFESGALSPAEYEQIEDELLERLELANAAGDGELL